MSILNKLMGKKPAATGPIGEITFEPVLKDRAQEEGAYQAWIRNHLWTAKDEKWSRRQMEKFTYRPTLGILMQCRNPKLEFLKESVASIFNQVYPFNELFIVDRGSSNPGVRALLESLEKDPRVKVSFQKGTEHDQEAIARIMKKTASEWLLLMGAEDIIEPNALYDMVATLQDSVEIDFVFADSDLIDDQGMRFAPQFKPVWAVGAHYPLGHYQHPILLHGRLIHKLRGHERVSALMDEGTLLDEASNHSRYVLQAPGIPYHARTRGLKNETPPPPVWNVLINDNYIKKGDEVIIDPEVRICTQPRVPLKILWLIDSLHAGDSELHVYYLARYFNREFKHTIHLLSSRDGAMRKLFEAFAQVTIGEHSDAAIQKLHAENSFDVALASSLREVSYPEILTAIDLPAAWQIAGPTQLVEKVQKHFKHPATIFFPSEKIAEPYRRLDERRISRLLTTSADLAEIKLYKQKNSPMDLRAALKISRKSIVFTMTGPTVEERGQKHLVEAALQLFQNHSEVELDFFLVGERPGAYLDTLKDVIAGSGKADRFHFVPESADPVKRYPFYWISDVCVTCSAAETFPMTTLEAMAFKKAVVGPNVFAINEVILNDENGFLYDPQNPKDLVEKLSELATNRDLADALGRISLEIAMEKFALKKSALRLERLLRESIVYVP